MDWLVVHGRFQPFHLGHLAYLSLALQRSNHVVVGITNPDPAQITQERTSDHRHLPSTNPFTYFERAEMILRSLPEAAGPPQAIVRIAPFDVSRRETWDNFLPRRCTHLVTVNEEWDAEKARRFSAAGFTVSTLPGNSARITATRVRELLDSGDEGWRSLVPSGTASVIDEIRRQPSHKTLSSHP